MISVFPRRSLRLNSLVVQRSLVLVRPAGDLCVGGHVEGIEVENSLRRASVRSRAARALGKLGAKASVGKLNQLMRNDMISNVRDAACAALVKIGGPQAQRALRKLDLDPKTGKQHKE